MTKNNGIESIDKEWEQRKLCSDGNCIGVVGNDGLCRECGKGSMRTEKTLSGEEKAPDSRVMEAGKLETSMDSDWDHRVLCSDESCIGIIGENGLCKECGKPFPDVAKEPSSGRAPD